MSDFSEINRLRLTWRRYNDDDDDDDSESDVDNDNDNDNDNDDDEDSVLTSTAKIIL